MTHEHENPLRAPGHQAEMMGATAAAAAVDVRDLPSRGNRVGQWIDVPCWQAIASTSKIEMAAYTYVGLPFSRMRGNVAVGLEPLPCKDGYVYTLWTADATTWRSKICCTIRRRSRAKSSTTIAGRQANDDVLRLHDPPGAAEVRRRVPG